MVANYPEEIYGKLTKNGSTLTGNRATDCLCPFINEECKKKSQGVKVPLGVCSVMYGGRVVALCPQRFLQDNTVFHEISKHYFGTTTDIILLSEVGLPDGMGKLDFVLVQHKPLSAEIIDYVVVEFQSADTSNTGQLVTAFKDFVDGKDISTVNYSYGINWANVWKRTLIQIMIKGRYMEEWGRNIYWVIQEPIYQNLVDRYGLQNMTFDRDDSTRFAVFDLKLDQNHYDFLLTRIESASVAELAQAVQTFKVPSEDEFIKKLQEKVDKISPYKVKKKRKSGRSETD